MSNGRCWLEKEAKATDQNPPDSEQCALDSLNGKSTNHFPSLRLQAFLSGTVSYGQKCRPASSRCQKQLSLISPLSWR